MTWIFPTEKLIACVPLHRAYKINAEDDTCECFLLAQTYIHNLFSRGMVHAGSLYL